MSFQVRAKFVCCECGKGPKGHLHYKPTFSSEVRDPGVTLIKTQPEPIAYHCVRCLFDSRTGRIWLGNLVKTIAGRSRFSVLQNMQEAGSNKS